LIGKHSNGEFESLVLCITPQSQDSVNRYFPFLFANLPPREVDHIFQVLESDPGDRPTTLRRLAAQSEDAGSIPPDVWLQLDGDSGEPRELIGMVCAQPLRADQLIHEDEFPNFIPILSFNEFQTKIRNDPPEIVPRMTF
jgi:hypothetical protein